MKILLAHGYYRERGGEDAVFEQEHAMLERAGHEVRAVTLLNRTASAWPKWKQLLCLFWNPWAYHEMRQRCLEFRPDILHVHNLFPFLSPSVIVAARRCGVRVVMTLHNYRLSCANGLFLLPDGRRCMRCARLAFGWPGLRYRCYRGSLPMTLAVVAANALHRYSGIWGQVTRFIAPSKFAADKLRSATGLTVGVKPHCVSGDWLPPTEEVKEPYAVFIGRFSEEKGILLLLEAWRRLWPLGFALHLVGEGPLAVPEIAGVVRHGRLPPASLKPLMEKAAFVVVPSLCYETMSRVVMEAYAAGTAVLAPSDSAPGSLVQEGVTGSLFASGNPEALAEAMQYFIDYPEAAAKMGRAAYAEYQRLYTETAGRENLLSLYEAVCSGS